MTRVVPAGSQAQLEEETRVAGRLRAVAMMDKREREGHADTNPYAQSIYRRWLMPLRDAIEAALAGTGKAGRRAAHVSLLKPLDAAAVAFIAVRGCMVSLLKETGCDARGIAREIGKEIYCELVLATFAHVKPEMFWELTHTLNKRNSSDARHRYNAMRHGANLAEVDLPMWGPTDREQVGLWLIERLRELGLLTVDRVYSKKGRTINQHFEASFSEAAKSVVDNIRGIVEVTMPFHLPFIEQPHDWTGLSGGGFYTDGMRRNVPYMVNMNRATRPDVIDQVRAGDLSTCIAAINKLQSVRWQINGKLLAAVQSLAKRDFDMDEVISQAEVPKPGRPEWLMPGMDKEQMDAEQVEEFGRWKRLVATWHTERKLRGTKWGRFYTATRIANQFKDYDQIYFLYQADFRGRLYAITTGVSPQGSDLQKALLRFADGKPLADDDAVRWFKINGANRFGVDKVPFADRIKWVDDNDRFIRQYADDPVAHSGWTEADCPLQFLAWCQEYAEWRTVGAAFLSHIPVGLDGSCNGLQHYSALLRDSVGGRATNLVPAVMPNDIYQQVANVVSVKLTDLKIDQLNERDWGFRTKWIAHGMNRKIVKRSVMTLPYGSTRFSCAEFIVEDYLRAGEAPEFEKHEYTHAANFLSHLVWDAIGNVVVAAAQAMSWLQKSASTLIKSGQSQIAWMAPSGFPVVQVYNEIEVVAVRSLLLGGVRIKVGSAGDDPAVNRHKNGIAPNFVHSLDASHLTLTAAAAGGAGIGSLAMIHDDYGTHAADTQKLFNLIRSTFVEMYETNNPLTDFSNRYSGLPAIPSRGDLDVQDVLKSPYFYA